MLNVLTGNLDREGGAMFTRAAAGQRNSAASPAAAAASRVGRWTDARARAARGARRAAGGCLAEEIDTPGEGQVRALITLAGNPLRVHARTRAGWPRRSTQLDFMVSIDIYVNETTRHADVILPAPEPLEKSHYDLALYQLAVRNVANYSPADPGVRGAARSGRRCCG